MFNTATGTLKILFSGGVFPIEFFVEIGDDFYCLRLKIVRGRQAVVYHKNGRIGKPFFEGLFMYSILSFVALLFRFNEKPSNPNVILGIACITIKEFTGLFLRNSYSSFIPFTVSFTDITA